MHYKSQIICSGPRREPTNEYDDKGSIVVAANHVAAKVAAGAGLGALAPETAVGVVADRLVVAPVRGHAFVEVEVAAIAGESARTRQTAERSGEAERTQARVLRVRVDTTSAVLARSTQASGCLVGVIANSMAATTELIIVREMNIGEVYFRSLSLLYCYFKITIQRKNGFADQELFDQWLVS